MSSSYYQKRILFTDNYIWAEKAKDRESGEIARELNRMKLRTKFGSKFKSKSITHRFNQLLAKTTFNPDEDIVKKGPPEITETRHKVRRTRRARRTRTESAPEVKTEKNTYKSRFVDIVLQAKISAEEKIELLRVIL